jgi:hypothetical protein
MGRLVAAAAGQLAGHHRGEVIVGRGITASAVSSGSLRLRPRRLSRASVVLDALADPRSRRGVIPHRQHLRRRWRSSSRPPGSAYVFGRQTRAT